MYFPLVARPATSCPPVILANIPFSTFTTAKSCVRRDASVRFNTNAPPAKFRSATGRTFNFLSVGRSSSSRVVGLLH